MASARQGESHGAKRAKRKTKRKTKIISCPDCGFKSDRAQNVSRHYGRIHEPAKQPFECCGSLYPSKGQYYQHCADEHPESRKATFLSRTKYKIGTTIRKEILRARRKSMRFAKRKAEEEEEEEEENVDFDEDTPLIYYSNKRNNQIVVKKEKVKCENYHEADMHSVKIVVTGDANSPLQALIQKEFLRNIDFDYFKQN